MPRKLTALALTLALLCAALPLCVHAEPLESGPPMPIAAKAAILADAHSGRIIFQHNPDEPLPMASLTKMMGILLAFEALEDGRVASGDIVGISAHAASMGGSQVLLEAGDSHPFSEMLKSMIVASANDATVAVGEHLFGSEALFVERMNGRAQELGLHNTHFVNSTGLPADGQHVSARDLLQLALVLARHPDYFDYATIWMDELTHAGGRITQLTNTNRLIRTYQGADGFKTGSTAQAGYCICATAKRSDMRYVAIVLGAQSGKERFAIASDMLDYGFSTYRRFHVAKKGARVRGGLPVMGGKAASLPLVLAEDFNVLIKKGDERPIDLVPKLPESLFAPVLQGQLIGKILVTHGGSTIGQVNVVAAEGVERQDYGTGWQRLWRRWFYR